MSRLDQAASEGLAPLHALRRWIGEPADLIAGGIGADALEMTAPSAAFVRQLAQEAPRSPGIPFLLNRERFRILPASRSVIDGTHSTRAFKRVGGAKQALYVGGQVPEREGRPVRRK